MAPRPEIEILRRGLARRPGIEAAPLVRPTLEDQRLGQVERPTVLKIESKKRRFDFAPEPHPRGIAELHAREADSRSIPAAMVPWPHHDAVAIGALDGVGFLEGGVRRRRAEDGFLVVPAPDRQYRNRGGSNAPLRPARLPVGGIPWG